MSNVSPRTKTNDMPPDSDSLKTANDSGFPLQIAVERQVTDTSGVHNWRVRHTEHSWVNPADSLDGFIDLVLENQYKTVYLVVECKRVRNATWLFLHPSGQSSPRRHAKAWASQYANGRMTHFNWYDIAIDPASPEATFCAVRGQSANEKSTLLERTAAQLVSATEALALEERDYRPDKQQSFRVYFNVIVTTADIKVARFDPEHISLSDGTLSEADIASVPYVRFRKQLSSRPVMLSPTDYATGTDTDYARQNTIFVVRAEALPEFLRHFDVSNDSLRQFHVG